MSEEREIEEIIKMLDQKTQDGVSRIKVEMSDELQEGQEQEKHHYGRCDVGSPWAKGTVRNFDAEDRGGCS
jgi:hypothetical protein